MEGGGSGRVLLPGSVLLSNLQKAPVVALAHPGALTFPDVATPMGNGRNTVSKGLFQRRELAEPQ